MVLQADLASSRSAIVFNADSESSAYEFQVDRLLRTTVENRSGRIHITEVITEVATQRNIQVIDVSGVTAQGVIPPADEIARRVDDQARPFSTRSEGALQTFSTAAETPDLSARIGLLNAAVATDPSFGLAQVARLEAAAQAGQDVSSLISEGQKLSNSFSAIDRARFDALAVRLTHAQLPVQEKEVATLAELLPNDPDVQAALGSLQVLRGDFEQGLRSLVKAAGLNPASAALRRQLAEGFVRSRKFADAEKVLSPLAERNPTLLPDLAAVILLNGDPARANKVFEQFVSLRGPNDPVTLLLRASWLAIGGQLNGAIALLESANTNDPGFRSAAMRQMAVWQLYTGNKAAGTSAVGSAPPASISALLAPTGHESPEQWQTRVAASSFGANEPVKDSILGFGFFLHADYAEAVPVWKRIVSRSGDSDLHARAMLAGSLDRAGQRDEARKVVVEPFLPELSDLYAAISFGEMRRMLGLKMQ